MKKFLILLITLTILFSSAGSLQAGVSDAAVLFLRIAAGARAAGMGEAFVAIADDATTTHWNPAGLGMYPLSSEYHTFKVGEDPYISNLALKVLKGDVDEDFSETRKGFEFTSKGIFRAVNGQRLAYEEFEVDKDESVLYFVLSSVSSNERETLKMAVRAVAQQNTGLTFEEINRQRKRLIDYYDSDKKESEINDYFEKMVANWQELRVKKESVDFLKEKIDFALEDNEISEKEYGEIMLVVDKAAEPGRPQMVKVPYSLLLSLWKDYASPWRKNLESIALVENGLPENNYKKYDIWAISSAGLLHFDGQEWLDGIVYTPKRNTTLEDIVYEQLNLEDEELLEDKKLEIAEFNSSVSWEQLNSLIDSLYLRLGEQNSDNLQESLEFLKTAWLNLTLNQARLEEFVTEIKNALAMETITPETVDRLSFLAARVDQRRLPDQIKIPFDLALSAEPRCIAGTGKYLWIGTDDGLYRFHTREQTWEKYDSTNGLPDSKIMSLSTYDGRNLWIATPKGVASYYAEMTTYGPDAGISDTAIYLVYAAAKNKVWAVSNSNFYSFDGKEWKDYFIYTASVNDTLKNVMREFMGYSDESALQNALYIVKTANQMQSDIPEPGQKIKIGFRHALTHRITNLAYDSRGRLWMGTDKGVKIFNDGKFTLFGYKPYTTEREMAIEEIAADFLGTENQGQIEQLTNLIKEFNKINSNKVPANTTVFIYSNPLGSEIHSLHADGSDVYIGTNAGLIQYTGDRFSYYYQEGLERQKTIEILTQSGETWFATPGKIVVFASAKSEITGMHANWLPELADDIYYEFLSYIHHLGEEWGTIGLNVTFLSYGELIRVDEYNNFMGTFNSFDMAIGLSYGKKMSNTLAAGLTAKWIYSRLSDQGAGRELGEGTGSSLGIDIGLLYSPARKLTFGAAITNLGPDISYIDAAQSDPLPRNLAIGLAYKLIDNPYNRLTLVGEVNKMLTGLDDGFSEELKEAIQNVGFEYWYGSFIAFRAGYIYDQVGEVKTPTLGVGIQYRGFRFDFAYIPSSDTVPLANTVRFSLTGRI